MANVHEPHAEFMEDFERQGGIAFFLIYYTGRNEFYYLRYCDLRVFRERAQEGGRKSFKITELNPRYFLKANRGFFVPFLDGIQMDLEDRD